MLKIYEITERYMKVLDLMENEELDSEMLKDTLEGIDIEFEEKAENYCKVLKHLESDIEMLDKAEKNITAKKKRIKNNMESLKNVLYKTMKKTGKDKIKGDIFTLAIQKNGGKRPIIINVPIDELPTDMVKIEKTEDKEKIREYLENNSECAFACFGDRGESIRIR